MFCSGHSVNLFLASCISSLFVLSHQFQGGPVKSRADDVYTLKLLDLEKYPQARCLDGSPGGYYVGPANGSNPNRWIIHLQGGGWCVDLEDCAGRAGTHYGSSKSWTSGTCPDPQNMACWADNPTGLPDGLGSSNASVSPLFADATHIWHPYCDGGSLAGQLDAPVPYNASLSLYFRGRFILDAIIDELFASEGLASATEVLLKGCSAGGQAVYLHADYIGERLRAVIPQVFYAAAPGAGMFLNVSAYGNSSVSFATDYRWIYEAQNASGSVNAACAAAHAGDDSAWQCFLSPVSLPYVATPLFIANSLVDSCAALFIMDLDCDARLAPGLPFACDAAQLAYLSAYRETMLSVVTPVLKGRPDHGAYLQACWTHIVEDDGVSWVDTRVAGQSQSDTFGAWWARLTGRSESGGPALATVAIDGEWGSNPTCSNRGTCY